MVPLNPAQSTEHIELANPRMYYDFIVRPIFERFSIERDSLELAFSTSILLYHFIDIYSKFSNKAHHDVFKEFSLKNRYVGHIRAVVNAAKHVSFEHKVHKGDPFYGMRLESIQKGFSSTWDDSKLCDDDKNWIDGNNTTVVSMPNGEKIDLFIICDSFMKFILNDILLGEFDQPLEKQ